MPSVYIVGQITLNGQVIPGLNMNTLGGLPLTSRGQTPTQQGDSGTLHTHMHI